MKLKQVIRRNIIYTIFAVFFITLILLNTGAYNIRVQYGKVPLDKSLYPIFDITMKTYKNDKELSEEVIESRYYYGIISSSQWIRRDNRIDLLMKSEDADYPDIQIHDISFRYLIWNVFSIDKTNIQTICDSEQEIEITDDNIIIHSTEQKAQLSFSSNEIIQISDLYNKISLIKAGIIAFILIILLSVHFIEWKVTLERKANHYKWIVLLSVALCLVVVMSLCGQENASPDENVSAESVKYYYSHWGLPDFKSEDVVGTISVHGNSRLKELTPYYFFAGKVGGIIEKITGYEKAYRLFNVILFALLIFLFIRKGKDKKWILTGIILTPQLWYLFSYTTSDAWDYAICCIIVLFLIFDDRIQKRILFSVIRGIVFFCLFTGKQNYYILALFSFLIYAERLFCQKKERKKLLIEYCIILLIAGALYGGRLLLDNIWYFGEKSEILSELKQNYQQYKYTSMIQKGVTMPYVITDTALTEKLFKSFTGTYGWMRFRSGEIYYWCIGFAYFVFLIYITRFYIKQKNARTIYQTVISLSMIFVAYMLVVYHCWTADFQAQGRYLFGAIPCIMYLTSKDKKLYESQPYEYFMQSVVMLSMYSFVRYGIMNIV